MSSFLRLILVKLPTISVLMYSLFVIFHVLKYSKLFAYWDIYLIGVILVSYMIRRWYLEGYEVMKVNELKKYPSWIKNHAIYGIDGYVKVKKKYLYLR